jgi:hypothetical protein
VQTAGETVFMTSETLPENTAAFDTANGVFDCNSGRGNFAVFPFLTFGQVFPFGFPCRHFDGYIPAGDCF